MALNFLSIISVDKNVEVRTFSLAIGNKLLDLRINNLMGRLGLMLMFTG